MSLSVKIIIIKLDNDLSLSVIQSVSHVTLCKPHGQQQARPPCPSLSPRACSISRPLSQWYYLIISSSVAPFSSCLQSFPASGFFPMSQLFTLGNQRTGASASASVLQRIFRIDFLAVQGTLRSLLQPYNLKALLLQHSDFLWFNSYMHAVITGKKYSFDYMDLCWQS